MNEFKINPNLYIIGKWLILERGYHLKTNIDYILSLKPDYFIEGSLLVDIKEFNELGFNGSIYHLVSGLKQHFYAIQLPLTVEVYSSSHRNIVKDDSDRSMMISDLDPSMISSLEGHTIVIRLYSEIKNRKRQSTLPTRYISFLQQSISNERERIDIKRKINTEKLIPVVDELTEEHKERNADKIREEVELRRQG